ncbi:MAG: dihydrolipoamide acyltransferase, partial [Meiothermus sp.]
MSEPQITPLARRLAEENGINWRSLAGSGPDGTIVERDILAYLAKVMAGEITLPPA